MSPKEQYKHFLNYGANLITLLVEGGCFAYMWYHIYAGQYGYWRRGNWAVIGLYVLVIFFFTKVFGGYNISYMRMTDVALSHTLAILLSGVVGYLELGIITRAYVEITPMLGVMAVELIFIFPWIYATRKIYTWLYPARQMLVIYGNYSPDELIAKINTRRDKYNICASVSYNIGHEQLYPMIKKYNAVVLCDLPAEARNQIMKYCYQESVRTYVTPKISDIIFRGADDIHLFDTPLLLSRNQGVSIDNRIIKRICDIVLSLIGIVLASPFMLIIALAVKLYDGGPVFYKQERLTIDEKPFMIYKFRSMSMDSEKNGARLAAKGDKRVTPVGKIIRNIHFDELPQLFNILIGDMSLVGPRPERPQFVEKFKEEIPRYMIKHQVRPGLTGWAQVNGYRGDTSIRKRIEYDLYYIENWTLGFDFKIIFLTFFKGFINKNAY